jgi:serine-type D-Ala-D-Ala carboxypeptidase/endopeptidase (penicillin-binding protein 4)
VPKRAYLGPRLLLAAAITALAAAGCGTAGSSTVTPAAKHARTSAALTTTPTVARVAHGRGPLTAAHSANVTKLGKRLTSAFKGQGPHTGTLVVDLGGSQTLYAHAAHVGRPPASVEKLYTTVSLLDLMGPNARLATTMLGTGHLGNGGVWHGNLYLQGGGDPTFGDGNWNRVYEDGQGPTASELVALIRKRGIKRVTGKLYADASLFDSDPGGPATDNKPDTPDYGGELSALVFDHGMTMKGLGPAAFAAHQVAATMKAKGIEVRSDRATRHTPATAQLLARVYSPPIKTMVRLMDVPSDDLFADLFAKQLGAGYSGHGSLNAGAIVIRHLLLTRYDLRPTLYDGSGLDKADRSSPTEVVSLLRQLYGTPTGKLLWDSLPVVGRQGTVSTIGLKTYAAGHCVAKTGTLNNVTNLAGYCRTRGGQTLAFAMFVDGPPNWTALVALSKAVGAIASY